MELIIKEPRQMIAEVVIAAWFMLILYLISRAIYSYNKERQRRVRQWEKEAEDDPYEFMADNEWAFIQYKNEVFPMTALEYRERWKTWNRKQKRNFYLMMRRNIRKGRLKKVKTEDGRTMYLSTNKGQDFLLKKYHKATQDVKRVYPTAKPLNQTNHVRSKRSTHRRKV